MEIKKTEKILTKGSQGSLLGSYSKRIEGYRFKDIPDFVEQILCLNKVLCYKCRDEIKIGDRYNRTSGGRIRKCYHSQCLESLYH